jgi:hypothetical protein
MTYRINALAATTTPDPVRSNNVGNTPLTLRTSETQAELALKAVADAKGGVKLEARNNGPQTATQVTVVATGAPLSGSGSGWKCTSHETSVACTRASLAAGKTATITLRPTTTITPRVAIESRVRAEKVYDQDSLNNGAAVTIGIPPVP